MLRIKYKLFLLFLEILILFVAACLDSGVGKVVAANSSSVVPISIPLISTMLKFQNGLYLIYIVKNLTSALRRPEKESPV